MAQCFARMGDTRRKIDEADLQLAELWVRTWQLPEEVVREYAGNIESHDAYTNYNINSNYGTKAAAGLVQDNSSSGGVA